MLLGYLVLGERFSRLQGAAIALAAAAVRCSPLGLGAPPWIALLLGVTFGGYGLLKNQLGLGPVISVFFETGLLAPLALAWLDRAAHRRLGRPERPPGGVLRRRPAHQRSCWRCRDR